MKLGGIVLCGGKSSRMGRAKAWLPFGDEFMLQRVVRTLREAVDVVVVVTAREQPVPPLSGEYALAYDEGESRGPLGGLAAGLALLEGVCDAVYLSACDVPFLKPAFVRRVVRGLEVPTPPAPLSEGKGDAVWPSPLPFRGGGPGGVDSSAAAPHINGFWHPLAAAYRVEVLPTVRAMLAANQLRMTDLLARVAARALGPDAFADIDSELKSLRNLNTPEEYAAALRELGAS